MQGPREARPFRKYGWSGNNEYIMHSTDSSIAFGGGGGFGLFLGADFTKGSTSRCDTFDNPPLCDGELFDCVSLEVWGFRATRDFFVPRASTKIQRRRTWHSSMSGSSYSNR